MLKVPIHEPIAIYCSIHIPFEVAKQLSLNCYNAGPGKSAKVEYKISPADKKKLLEYVRTAPNSAFEFDCLKEGKYGESNFADTLKRYNETHDDSIGIKDLIEAVRHVSDTDAQYIGGKVSQARPGFTTKYDNGVFHEWRLPLSVLFKDSDAVDESVKGSTRKLDKDALYVKLFVENEPDASEQKGAYDEGDKIHVASMHRNSDSKFFSDNNKKYQAREKEIGYKAKRQEEREQAKKANEYFKGLFDRYSSEEE